MSIVNLENLPFTSTIDKRFETQCISCPPGITNPDYYCIWQFTLKK